VTITTQSASGLAASAIAAIAASIGAVLIITVLAITAIFLCKLKSRDQTPIAIAPLDAGRQKEGPTKPAVQMPVPQVTSVEPERDLESSFSGRLRYPSDT